MFIIYLVAGTWCYGYYQYIETQGNKASQNKYRDRGQLKAKNE